MRNGFALLSVRAFYQRLATGIIILVAMLIDKFASRWWWKTGVSMGDPRAFGAQIRMKLPSLTPPKGMVPAEMARRNGAARLL